MIYTIAIAVVVLLSLVVVIIYNTLIGRKNQVENIFASTDALLKKRYDLIPNLVTTVKEYMKHERETLTKVTELRAKAVNSDLSDDDKVSLNNELSGLMGHLKVAVENYPELKANENFLKLQASWNEVEEQISAARRAFNAAVTDYNNAVEMFPSNLIAGMFNFKRKEVFEIPETERQNISAKELFKA